MSASVVPLPSGRYRAEYTLAPGLRFGGGQQGVVAVSSPKGALLSVRRSLVLKRR